MINRVKEIINYLQKKIDSQYKFISLWGMPPILLNPKAGKKEKAFIETLKELQDKLLSEYKKDNCMGVFGASGVYFADGTEVKDGDCFETPTTKILYTLHKARGTFYVKSGELEKWLVNLHEIIWEDNCMINVFKYKSKLN